MTNMNGPCVLMILDGWGIGELNDSNAVFTANTPFLDHIRENYPNTRLSCFGEAVGLPAGIMGNSEVGHLNIGAGRVVYQGLLRIDKAIEDSSFFNNDALGGVMSKVKSHHSALPDHKMPAPDHKTHELKYGHNPAIPSGRHSFLRC